MKINKDVTDKIAANVGDLLTTYSDGIQAAISDEGQVAVSLPVKIIQNGDKVDIQVGISFVKERIKDTVTFTVSDQRELFKDGGASVEAKILHKATEVINGAAFVTSEEK